MKKFTKATFKKFIKENGNNLLIKVSHNHSDERFDKTFVPVTCARQMHSNNNFGYEGIWLVEGKNWFENFNENDLQGVRVGNGCGNFIVAIPA